MNTTFKRVLGVILLLTLGFIAYVVFSAIGFTIALIFHLVPWWKIILGTLGGTVIVVLHLTDYFEKEDKKNDC